MSPRVQRPQTDGAHVPEELGRAHLQRAAPAALPGIQVSGLQAASGRGLPSPRRPGAGTRLGLRVLCLSASPCPGPLRTQTAQRPPRNWAPRRRTWMTINEAHTSHVSSAMNTHTPDTGTHHPEAGGTPCSPPPHTAPGTCASRCAGRQGHGRLAVCRPVGRAVSGVRAAAGGSRGLPPAALAG